MADNGPHDRSHLRRAEPGETTQPTGANVRALSTFGYRPGGDDDWERVGLVLMDNLDGCRATLVTFDAEYVMELHEWITAHPGETAPIDHERFEIVLAGHPSDWQ